MTFFAPEMLLLLWLIPPVILFLLFMRRKSIDADYPFVRIFSSKSMKRSSLKSFIMKIIRIILLSASLASAVMYSAKPSLKGDKTEYLVIFIDRTPLMRIEADRFNSIIDSLKSCSPSENTIAFVNEKRVSLPVKEKNLPSRELREKERVAEFIGRKIFSLRSKSVKSVLLTDRIFERFNLETDIISMREIPRVMITGISRGATLFSRDETAAEVRFTDENGREKKSAVMLSKGENRIPSPFSLISRIDCFYDTLIFDSPVFSAASSVNDRTGSAFVKGLLRALEIEENDTSSVEISYDASCKRGIVFSRENQAAKEKSPLFSVLEGYDAITNDMNRNLEYSLLAEIPGEAVIMTKRGEKILSRQGDVFYFAFSPDTSASNLVLLPSFVSLSERIFNEIFSLKEAHSDSRLEYRRELTESFNGVKNDYSPAKLKDVSFVFLFVSALLLIILIFI